MTSVAGWRKWRALPLAAGLVSAAGCAQDDLTADEGLDPSAETVQSAMTNEGDVSPRGPGSFRPPPPGGPEVLLFTALRELDLTETQQASIESTLGRIRPGPPGPAPRDRAAFAALAEGVRAGSIDAEAVLAKVDRAPADYDRHRAALASALQTLHGTLSASQRRALVDALVRRFEEGPPSGAARSGPRPGEMGPLRPLLLASLALTDDQCDTIQKALWENRPPPPDRDATTRGAATRREEMRTRLESFAQESFDATLLTAPPDGPAGRGPRHPLEAMIDDLQIVVPILEPDQRETLASILEKGPPPPPAFKP